MKFWDNIKRDLAYRKLMAYKKAQNDKANMKSRIVKKEDIINNMPKAEIPMQPTAAPSVSEAPSVVEEVPKKDFFLLNFFKSIFSKVPEEQRGLIYVFFGIFIMFTSVSLGHLVSYFLISNALWYATLLAVSFELASFSVIIGFLNVKYLGRWILPIMLFIIVTILAIGNIYASYLDMDSSALKVWCEMLGWDTDLKAKRIVAVLQGLPIPVLALLFSLAIEHFVVAIAKEKYEL